MKVIEKINKIISLVLKVFMVIFFAWMIIAVSIQVFGRYLFGAGFPWTEETARYCMIWLVFFGAAYVTINSEHVKVSAVEDLLKGMPRKIIAIIQNIVSLFFTGIILYFSFSAIKIAKMSVSANSGLNMGLIYLIFPIAMIIMIWAYIYRLIKNFMEIRKSTIEGGK